MVPMEQRKSKQVQNMAFNINNGAILCHQLWFDSSQNHYGGITFSSIVEKHPKDSDHFFPPQWSSSNGDSARQPWSFSTEQKRWSGMTWRLLEQQWWYKQHEMGSSLLTSDHFLVGDFKMFQPWLIFALNYAGNLVGWSPVAHILQGNEI